MLKVGAGGLARLSAARDLPAPVDNLQPGDLIGALLEPLVPAVSALGRPQSGPDDNCSTDPAAGSTPAHLAWRPALRRPSESSRLIGERLISPGFTSNGAFSSIWTSDPTGHADCLTKSRD